jgi:hypothetical protein
VRVHSVAPTSAPFIVKAPTAKVYSLCAEGSCAQQTLYRSAPAVPATPVERSYTSFWVDAVTAFGFVSPLNEASGLPPQAVADAKTSSAFEADRPLLADVSCSKHLTVSVHALASRSGPRSENAPISKP